jgi:hypothetical protein
MGKLHLMHIAFASVYWCKMCLAAQERAFGGNNYYSNGNDENIIYVGTKLYSSRLLSQNRG